ncbi:MAG: GatB/YqeY domain-containing protein [Proteobacteria bacterium]|nr:GatB/YqeY domain-containing protein [Pseudomonadota bacterium]
MLRTSLSDQLKAAMKAREQRKVSTLRLILAALKDRDIAARANGNAEGIGDEDILQLLAKMVRQRRESIKLYEQGGRVDLAEREAEEIEIIESFMPRQLDGAELEAAVREAIKEVGATGLKDMGRAMAALKARYAGRMDFAKASTLVKQKLV